MKKSLYKKILVFGIILLVIGSVVIPIISGNFKILQDVNEYVILDNGIVGCWHFDEEIGNIAYDSSGNNNNGTVIGAEWIMGIFGNALEFDGVDDYVDFGNPSEVLDFGTGDFTIIYWIYPYSTSGSYKGLVDLENITPEYRFSTVFHNNKLQVYTNDAHWHDTGRSLDINTWSQVIWVKRDNDLKLYINGIFSGWSMIHMGQVGPVEKMQFGKYAAGYESFDGIMDEVIFYDYGLSDGEIIELYIPDIVYVDDDFDETTQGWGYDHFDNIQDGIDAVNISGTIYVNKGTYTENILIDRPLELKGEDRDNTIIDGSGDAYAVILDPNAHNVFIMDLTITESLSCGIWLGSPDSIIENVVLCGFTNDYAVYGKYSGDNSVIRNCYIHDNEIGIYDDGSDGMEVYNCTIINNSVAGIKSIPSTTNMNIYHNNLINNPTNAIDNSEGSNLWDYNYYDDYTGEDLDGDGIGDIPYDIEGSAGEQDLHPYMNPNGWMKPDNVYVDDDFNSSTSGWGYDHFDSIQVGIDAVAENGTVYVNNGNYTESHTYFDSYVYIDKSLNLIGENKNTTIINCPDFGQSGGQTGIRIGQYPLVVGNVLISGFTLAGGDDSGSIGIYPQHDCHNITIEDCIVHNFADGMQFVEGCRYISIRDCITYNNPRRGGISFAWYDVSDIEISRCISYSNSVGIEINHILNGIMRNCWIYQNSEEGVELYDSNNVTILLNNISNNDIQGLRIRQSKNNIIYLNTITENKDDGIALNLNSENNEVNNNYIANNLDDGIQIYGSNYNLIVRNNIIENNETGIQISENSFFNKLYHNNIINNTVNAVDECGNIWNDTYPSGGNYWSDYWGDDLYSGPNQDIPGSDGIGDVPYEIPCEHGTDWYPLINPWGGENQPPSVEIINPKEGYFHFSGIPLLPTPLNLIADTISLGGFRLRPIIINATDDIDVSEDLIVNIYLDGEYQGNASYCCDWRKHEWFWTGWGFGNYILKITAEDSQGAIGSVEIKVCYFCFLP